MALFSTEIVFVSLYEKKKKSNYSICYTSCIF